MLGMRLVLGRPTTGPTTGPTGRADVPLPYSACKCMPAAYIAGKYFGRVKALLRLQRNALVLIYFQSRHRMRMKKSPLPFSRQGKETQSGHHWKPIQLPERFCGLKQSPRIGRISSNKCEGDRPASPHVSLTAPASSPPAKDKTNNAPDLRRATHCAP